MELGCQKYLFLVGISLLLFIPVCYCEEEILTKAETVESDLYRFIRNRAGSDQMALTGASGLFGLHLGLSYLQIFYLMNIHGNTKTSFEDFRCKCVCPKFQKNANTSLNEKTVYISNNVDPNNCNCASVVKDEHLRNDLCALCQCKFENRNTTTIKVVVIIIICVISLLLAYMMFLLILDPLIAHRPGAYQEHTDEVVNLDDQTVSQVPQFEERTRPRLGRQKSVINYMSSEQKRWKSTVQEQRRNIYDKHTMLN